MERGSIVLAIGFSIVVGLYCLSIGRTDVRDGDSSVQSAAKRQARQVSLAGIEIAINRFRQNNFTSFTAQILGGNDTVTVADMGSGQKKVVSTATYGWSGTAAGQSHQIIGLVQIPQGGFNIVLLRHQTAMQAQGQSLAITPSVAFLVDGSDTSSEESDSKPGIGASPQLGAGTVITALVKAGGQDRVVGFGDYPSVAPLYDTVNMRAQVREVQHAATIVHRSGSLGTNRAWGTVSAPEIVYVTRSLTVEKRLTGAGILCIDGNLVVKNHGRIDWIGYLIVHGNVIKAEIGGSAEVIGTAFFGKGGNLQFGSQGNLKIIYDTPRLRGLDATMFGQPGKPSIVRMFE